MTAPFRDPVHLVRWLLGPGALRMGGLKAIDYGSDGGGARDHYAMHGTHDLYARAVLALAASGDDEPVLRRAYGDGRSDAAMATAAHCGEWQVRRARCRGLAAVRAHALEIGLLRKENP